MLNDYAKNNKLAHTRHHRNMVVTIKSLQEQKRVDFVHQFRRVKDFYEPRYDPNYPYLHHYNWFYTSCNNFSSSYAYYEYLAKARELLRTPQ